MFEIESGKSMSQQSFMNLSFSSFNDPEQLKSNISSFQETKEKLHKKMD